MICMILSCEKGNNMETVPVPSYAETEDYVDLGLDGLLFATKNLGAKSPEESGYYFAWGEVKPKSYYDWKTYKWAEPTTEENYVYDNLTFSKYYYLGHNNPDYAFLQPEDDAATVLLGEDWHTPTYEEMFELHKCACRKAVKNGVFGYEYIGPNGNSIFLPACGEMLFDQRINAESGVDLWCSDCPTGTVATILYINKHGHVWNDKECRYLGIPIRPVKTKRASEVPELILNVLNRYIEQAEQLLATIEPEDYSAADYNELYDAYRHAIEVRENAEKKEAMNHAEKQDKQEAINNAAMRLHLAIIDLKPLPKPSDIKAVDLGLSVRWASANIGARDEDEYGYYISWGELTPKPIGYYRWNDYKLCKEVNEDNNDYSLLTEYVTMDGWGEVDNKTRLDLEDDAAHAYLGGDWRMPTSEEAKELIEKCTFVEMVRRGEPVLKVIGPNGNYILFPYAGYATWQTRTVFTVFCWTSDLCPDYPIRAYGFELTGFRKIQWTERIDGLTVRAVCP